MADKLTFSGMTWELLEEKYGVVFRDDDLFTDCAPIEPSPVLVGMIQRGRKFWLPNELARAHRLVDPVLGELEMAYGGKITTIPGPYLEVKDQDGLSGIPDFVIAAGTRKKLLPIVAVVEAKKDDIDSGLPACAAELYAAHLLDKHGLKRFYGCVTTGLDWRFLRFDADAKQVVLDRDTYVYAEVPKILGILHSMVDASLAALEAHAAAQQAASSTPASA